MLPGSSFLQRADTLLRRLCYFFWVLDLFNGHMYCALERQYSRPLIKICGQHHSLVAPIYAYVSQKNTAQAADLIMICTPALKWV